jgi:DNA-binding protein YbaB
VTTGPEPPGWLDRLSALQAETRQLADRFAVAMASQSRRTARDSSGAVEVTLDGRGRVDDVVLRSSWRRDIDDGGLAAAIIDAVSNGQQQHLLAFATNVADHEPDPAMRGLADDTSRVPFRPESGPAGPDAQQAMRELLSLVETAETQLDTALRAARERAGREHVGHDAGRHVTVRVTANGGIRSIEVDEDFLRQVQDEHTNRALRDAFTAAYRDADTVGSAAEAPDDALRQLKALTDDPHELLRRLFGGR